MLEWNDLATGFGDDNVADLVAFIQDQRWFGAKAREIVGTELIDQIVIREDPQLIIVLVEMRMAGGRSDIYQLVLAPLVGDGSGWLPITTVGATTVFEVSDDPRFAELITMATEEGTLVTGAVGEARFRTIRDTKSIGHATRSLNADQSNTSIVIDEQLLLKIYRRLEAGTNPELEILLFLTEHDFAHVPELAGWISYNGSSIRTTLGIAQQFIPKVIDGWTLGIQELADRPVEFLARLGRLGEIIGEMHIVLACDHHDPAFLPEEPTDESAAILGAKLEDQIDLLADTIPSGRSEELRSLARVLTEGPVGGLLIRSHGDLHLGQVLWTGDDWMIIDFEGEPTRSLADRRQKLHPLRDIAGLLRSFSYLVVAHELDHKGSTRRDWEREASETFLSSYRTKVEGSGLLPDKLETQDRMLRVFKLEKILYELEYEMQHRPEWLRVPLAGIEDLLTGHETKQ